MPEQYPGGNYTSVLSEIDKSDVRAHWAGLYIVIDAAVQLSAAAAML